MTILLSSLKLLLIFFFGIAIYTIITKSRIEGFLPGSLGSDEKKPATLSAPSQDYKKVSESVVKSYTPFQKEIEGLDNLRDLMVSLQAWASYKVLNDLARLGDIFANSSVKESFSEDKMKLLNECNASLTFIELVGKFK
ncbi:MAG: hypothetical protein FJX80_12505 [Bacteroidetes bacterium]|nr:hypothetical protein [Bacteroidota bacterium]